MIELLDAPDGSADPRHSVLGRAGLGPACFKLMSTCSCFRIWEFSFLHDSRVSLVGGAPATNDFQRSASFDWRVLVRRPRRAGEMSSLVMRYRRAMRRKRCCVTGGPLEAAGKPAVPYARWPRRAGGQFLTCGINSVLCVVGRLPVGARTGDACLYSRPLAAQLADGKERDEHQIPKTNYRPYCMFLIF